MKEPITFYVNAADSDHWWAELSRQGWAATNVQVTGMQPGETPAMVIDYTRETRGLLNEKTWEDIRLVIR